MRVLGYVRLRPFSAQTAEDRSRERYRRLTLTALASMSAKGVKVLTALVSVPLTINYLGTERYGLWMTIGSLVTVLAFADLGLGNGLLNAISDADGRDDKALAGQYVSSAFVMLLSVSLLLAVALAVVYPLIDWGRIFNVTSARAVAEAGPAAAVFLCCFLVNLPAGVVQRIQLGYQEGFSNSLWEAAGSVLGLIGILFVTHYRAGLPWLVLAMAGGPTVALVLNAVVLFAVRRTYLRPSLRRADRATAITLFRVGMLFFVLQVVGAAAFFSDNLVAAHTLGAPAVTQYAVPMKLFDMVVLVCSFLLAPLWPAYGEAIARGDHRWAKRMLTRSLTGTLIGTSIASLCIVLGAGAFLRIWAGGAVHPPMILLVGFGIWTVLNCCGSAVAMFLNGVSAIRFQAVCAVAMGVSALTLKIVFARQFGLPGIIWGTIIAYSVCTAIPIAFYLPRLLLELGRHPQRAPERIVAATSEASIA
ncbi:MAG: lipopolysaccharide biosynthesis protein [Gemmatimonadaceae bacterium]